jgi:hypothetical protein
VIVVVGSPALRLPDASGESPDVAGIAARIAVSAAAAGATVQFAGKIGDDDAGDAVVLAFAKAGVGHAALQRDAGIRTLVISPAPDEPLDPTAESSDPPPPTEPATGPEAAASLEAADVELALRYLTDFRVVVLTTAPGADTEAVIDDAVAYAGAKLILVVPPGSPVPASWESATVLESPESDPDERFAQLVGQYAAALDRGVPPDRAFKGALGAAGWEAASSKAT